MHHAVQQLDGSLVLKLLQQGGREERARTKGEYGGKKARTFEQLGF
jgi:hypothetical protein